MSTLLNPIQLVYDRLNRATCTVVLNSVPDQLGRKQIYHYKRRLRAYCPNIYTVVTLPSCLRRLLNQNTMGSNYLFCSNWAILSCSPHIFMKNQSWVPNIQRIFLPIKSVFLVYVFLFFFVKTISFDMKLVEIRNWQFRKSIYDLGTLESGINVALRLLVFRLFSRGYGLIPDFIV